MFEELVLPAASAGGPKAFTPPNAPSDRFIELANVYAALATSDPVERLIRRHGPLRGSITAIALKSTNGSDAPLPLVAVNGVSTSPERAMAVADRAAQGLRDYIEIEQRKNGIPDNQRVILSIVKEPGPTTTDLLKRRSKTLPIVIFLTTLLAFVGLTFILENLRPRIRPVPSEVTPVVTGVQTRRPA